METIEKEKSKGGISHHVSHFLLKSRPTTGYDSGELTKSILALQQEKNTTQSPRKIEKINKLLEILSGIDVSANVEISIKKEIQASLDEYRIYKGDK